MKTPEWDIFKRVERLEKLKPTVDEVGGLAIATFQLVFLWLAAEKPTRIRRLKDNLIVFLKEQGISGQTLDSLQTFMLQVCGHAEKQR